MILLRLLSLLGFACYLHGHSPDRAIDLKIFDLGNIDFDWNLVEASQQLGQKSREVRYYDPDELSKAYISHSYDMREGLESIYQSRKKIREKLGHLLPRLSINLDAANIPGVFADFVSNVFGFLVPFNWFKYFEARQFYDARMYSYLDTLLDQHALAQVTYLHIHKLKVDYGIRFLILEKVKEMLAHYDRDRESNEGHIAPILYEMFQAMNGDLRGDMLKSREEALSLLPSLGTFLGVERGTGSLDILRLNLPDPLEVDFIDMQATTRRAKRRSLDLKHWRYLVKASEYTYKSQVSSPLSAPGDGDDFRGFGLSFGLDTIANVQISDSQLKEIKIKYKRAKSVLDQLVSALVFKHNEVIENYKFLMKEGGDFSVAYRALENTLQAHNESGEICTDIHQIEYIISSLLRRNRLVHELMICKALIKRYLVKEDYSMVMELLPVRKELKRLRKWAKDKGKKKPKSKKKRFKAKVKRFFRLA